MICRGRRCVLVLIAVGAVAGLESGVGQSTRPSPPARKHAVIREALELLEAESRQAKRDLRLPTSKPDFAERFGQEIPQVDLIGALMQPVHRDSFIDAYSRWQLTSFEAPVPAHEDREFLNLLNNMPAMVENPAAEATLVSEFEAAEKQSQLMERDLARLREASAELDRRAPIADAFNVPAEAYREWIAAQFQDTPSRQVLLLIERCAATIKAGWPSREIKTKLTKAFKDAGANSAISPQQRQLIADSARRLVGLKRKSIDEIAFMADGTVEVKFTIAAVDDADVEKWIEHLTGKSP